jgi:hypothetical protein
MAGGPQASGSSSKAKQQQGVLLGQVVHLPHEQAPELLIPHQLVEQVVGLLPRQSLFSIWSAVSRSKVIPHAEQNRFVAGFWAEHWEQTFGTIFSSCSSAKSAFPWSFRMASSTFRPERWT